LLSGVLGVGWANTLVGYRELYICKYALR